MGCWWIAEKRGVPTDTKPPLFVQLWNKSLLQRDIVGRKGPVDKVAVKEEKKKSFIFLASGFIVKADKEKIQVKGQNLWVLNS